jgi:hypothetical protein
MNAATMASGIIGASRNAPDFSAVFCLVRFLMCSRSLSVPEFQALGEHLPEAAGMEQRRG